MNACRGCGQCSDLLGCHGRCLDHTHLLIPGQLQWKVREKEMREKEGDGREGDERGREMGGRWERVIDT